MSGIAAIPYEPSAALAWNGLNATANGGHFLFDRGFMEYHADRFEDASLLFEKDGVPIAIFPANRSAAQIHSHQGLTFGGVIHAGDASLEDVLAIFDVLISHARQSNASSIVYKAVPGIYHNAPAGEALYALFRRGAVRSRSEATATIDYRAPGTRSKRRVRSLRKSAEADLSLGWDDAWEEYWVLLTDVLGQRHHRTPVHTAAEIRLLSEKFPNNIRLCVARKDNAIAAGIVVFETATVAHAQYMASSPYGRTLCALDAVIDHLLEFYKTSKRYFDFGISTEEAGMSLNTGLATYKREWGASCIVHDTFELAF